MYSCAKEFGSSTRKLGKWTRRGRRVLHVVVKNKEEDL
jgi:hypothetical protein